MRKYLIALVVLVVIGGGAAYVILRQTRGSAVTYRTEPATRGDLMSTISGTGTLEPEEVVDVGAQVPGLIREFGKGTDGRPIDYGSQVEEGTVLLQIDDRMFVAKADQSRALVKSAEQKVAQAKSKAEAAVANTKKARADLKVAMARAAQTARDWERAKTLRMSKSISDTEYDAAQSAYEINEAGIGVAQAAIDQSIAAEADAIAAIGDAEAAVATAKAVLRQDEINVGYTTIKSTVKGTIIDRRVTLGQTVQSSLSTQSVFLIAKDLSTIKVWASVNESDFGQIIEGQTAHFTVEAFPSETFRGTVESVRLNATNNNNVVVYTVVVSVDDAADKLQKFMERQQAAMAEKRKKLADSAEKQAPKGKPVAKPKVPARMLVPYMTANLKFEVDSRKDVLLVPNAALRYRPSGSVAAPAAGGGKGAKDKANTGTVWVEEDGKPKAIPVTLGLTDGISTEVLSGDVTPDMHLIVAEIKGGAASGAGENPFAAPKMGGGKKQ